MRRQSMFGHNTAALAAQTLPVLEMLEQRYCFSAAVVVEGAAFKDPVPFEDELKITGENTSDFTWGVNQESGAGGSGLKFEGVVGGAEDDRVVTFGNLIFHNTGTIGGEA